MKRFTLILLLVCLSNPLAWCAPDPVKDLFQEAQKARNERRFDDALHIYERISAEYPERANDARSGIADTFFRQAQVANDEHRLDDALHLYERISTEYPARANDARSGIADTLFRKAQAANDAHKPDDALSLYERILEEHPERLDAWFPVQRNIAETLARKGDLAEAAKAAHLCLDIAPNPQAFNEAVAFAANILSALDKNVDRANQFLAFQQSGSAGGAVNPMDAVGYPSLPNRERAFETMRQQAGDTPAASRIRAYTFLLTGKPKEALAQFADGFRRSSTFSDLQRAGLDLTTIGLRDVRGCGIGIETAVQFVIFGPNGKDGKPNTPDDLTDPFAEWLPAAPAPGEGGLADPSADDLATLRKVRDACALYAGDSLLEDYLLRYHAFAVLHRTHIALDDWGIAGQKDWYLQYAFEFGNLTEVLPCTLAAARDRALHFGGVYPLLDEIDAKLAAQDVKPKNGIEKARAQFDALCAELNRASAVKVSPIKPLSQPASF